jgi:hypothetical protein
MMQSYTREEFYELVWSKPMVQLAPEFNLSDVALHKLCRKRNIPTPPRGWWARKSAGQEMARTPLPPGPSYHLTFKVDEPDALPITPYIEDVRNLAAKVAQQSEVPSDWTDPIVIQTIKALNKAAADARGAVKTDRVDLIACDVFPSSIDRLQPLLDAISAHANQHGFHIKPGKRAACFSNGSVEIGFTVTEGQRHIPSHKEKAQLNAWERRGKNTQISYPRIPDWDYFADERLHLELDRPRIDYGANIRGSFNDTRLRRLEAMPEQIAIELAVIAAARAEFLARRAEKQRRVDEKQKRREEGYRREYILQRRRDGVAEILKEAGELELMSAQLAALKQYLKGAPRGPRVTQLVEWAGQDLARRRLSISAAKLENRLAEKQLFGHDDGRGFKPHQYRKDDYDFEWDDNW